MCDIVTKRQKLQIEQSEKRQRLNELLGLDGLADEQRGELDTLTKRMQQLEVELRGVVRRAILGNYIADYALAI